MIRLLLFFVGLAVIAYGGMWLVQHPGHVSLDWFGYRIETSAALLVLAIALAAIVGWIILRIVLGLPSFVRVAARQRRREKGYAALSSGMVAVGSGDAYGASRASAKASRHLKDDTLALVLEAQSAHLNGNGAAAVRAFEALARRKETHVLGLRGLYSEAQRRGDDEAARHFAEAAYKAGPLPWSAKATLEHRARENDWEAALQTVEASVAARLVDKETGQRQRAVLETAIAYDKEATAPDTALALAQAAMKRAPDLAPPVVVAARVLSRRGDIRKAAKLIERAWPQCQHPDIGQAYLDVRAGDSTADRLSRAKTLMGIANFDPVSRMLVGRSALASTDYATARSAMAPLVAEGQRPTVRMCLLMAEIEEAEFGDIGQWREWLARASRASLDPAWVADGIVYDAWSPVSPTTGKLDAFRWQVPAERVGPTFEALPSRRVAPPRDPALPAASAPALPPAQPQQEQSRIEPPAPEQPRLEQPRDDEQGDAAALQPAGVADAGAPNGLDAAPRAIVPPPTPAAVPARQQPAGDEQAEHHQAELEAQQAQPLQAADGAARPSEDPMPTAKPPMAIDTPPSERDRRRSGVYTSG